MTDEHGRFALPTSSERSDVITASKQGYFITGVSAAAQRLEILLTPLPVDDDPEYSWVDPRPDVEEADNCGNCHGEIYDQWQQSGHASSARNRHFLNLFDGTDWHGQPNRGWNLLSDRPDAASVCASCHVPTLALDDPAISDPRLTSGVAAEGIHCDFCHKIQDAPTEDIGLAHGRFGLQLLRPSTGQVLFGPLDDVDRGVETHAPVQKESRYCASCHEGTVLGIHVYSTFSEWLASPARQSGRQCQSCHMAPDGRMTNIAPGAGGIERDPETLASHQFLPGGREAMLRRCLDVTTSSQRNEGEVVVEVKVTADDVGHRVPTGFIDRHLILVVQPLDGDGKTLPMRSGPVLPLAAGQHFRGQPGQLFAKFLSGNRGEPLPFWRAEEDPVDTRLFPGVTHLTTFDFPLQTDSVRVQLIYRRFWDEVARDKDWPTDQIVVVDQEYPVDDSRR